MWWNKHIKCFVIILLFSATAIAKISRIQNHVSVEVCQIQRFVFSIWAKRRPPSKTFHYVSTWCQMNTNSWALKLWKLDVSVPTNTWSSTAAKINSTFVCAFIHSTSFGSTRCCHVPELIGMLFLFFNFFFDTASIVLWNCIGIPMMICFEHWVMNSMITNITFDILDWHKNSISIHT